jgi:hypothetical protein
MRECVEEGTLQAYFDGELSSDMMERVATHIAACTACAEAVREIENESLLLAEAFAPEMALSVPTGRLYLRLDAAIAELQAEQQQSRSSFEAQASRLRAWFAALAPSFSFVPQHAVGFASLIVIAAFGAIFAFIVLRPQPSTLNVAQGVKTIGLPSFEAGQGNNTTNQGQITPVIDSTTRNQAGGARIIKAGSRRTPRKVTPSVVEPIVDPLTATPETASVQLLPGEKNYLKAIASLDTAIKAGGDNAMRPTLRVEYERNLRVVDEAIAQTRAVAQRNPNDKDASEFLLSAYQSKVELLNTVAEQAQLSTVYR